MTTFDKREEGFEKQFAHDEELRFKATACNPGARSHVHSVASALFAQALFAQPICAGVCARRALDLNASSGSRAG